MKEWNDNCLELYDKIRQVPDNAKKNNFSRSFKRKDRYQSYVEN